MLCDKTYIEFCTTCFEELQLQLMSKGMMHVRKIVKSYSKYHPTKACQDDNVLRMIFHEVFKRAYAQCIKVQSFSMMSTLTPPLNNLKDTH